MFPLLNYSFRTMPLICFRWRAISNSKIFIGFLYLHINFLHLKQNVGGFKFPSSIFFFTLKNGIIILLCVHKCIFQLFSRNQLDLDLSALKLPIVTAQEYARHLKDNQGTNSCSLIIFQGFNKKWGKKYFFLYCLPLFPLCLRLTMLKSDS